MAGAIAFPQSSQLLDRAAGQFWSAVRVLATQPWVILFATLASAALWTAACSDGSSPVVAPTAGPPSTPAAGTAQALATPGPTPLTNPSAGAIPLDEVWAVDMPGTRPINRTQAGDPPTYTAPEGQLADEILAALRRGASASDTGECFAVAGEGMDALRAVHAVLVGGKVRHTSFGAGEPITIAFFSYPYPSYIHLVGAEQDQAIQLQFAVVPRETREPTANFALVPVQFAKIGTSHVGVRLEHELAAATTPVLPRIVCRSFSFDVSQ